MSRKFDSDAKPGIKILRLFLKLFFERRRHFQTDLAKAFYCSPQTIYRWAEDSIRPVIGLSLVTGIEGNKRWYQIKDLTRNHLGLEFEELRWLVTCLELAGSSLPEDVRKRIAKTIFNLSVLMADRDFAKRDAIQKQQFAFFSKGHIDYTPHQATIEKLLQAAEEKRFCLVRYKASGKTEDKEHRFAPGRIVSMSGALYIIGAIMTEDFAAVRHPTTLAIHRITDITLTERQFDFDPPEPEPGSFGLPWHEPRTLRVRFKPGAAADYVRERIWADEQKMIELEDGGLLLEITTRSEPEFTAWVGGFRDEAGIE